MYVLEEEAQRRERENFISNGRSEKKQTTLPLDYTPRKARPEPPEPPKQPPGREIVDPEVSDNGASASKPRPLPQIPKLAAEPATAEWDSYDTTSDEDEDDYAVVNGRAKSPTRGNTLQPSAMTKTPASSSKTKRSSQEDDLLGDLSDSGAEEMLALADASAKAAIRHGKQRESPITPSTTRTTNVENGLPTPSLTKGKSPRKVLFNGSEDSEHSRGGNASPKRQRLNAQTEGVRLFGTSATVPQRLSPPTASSTIPPRSSSPAPSSLCTQTDATNLTSEVMDLLKGENIAPAKLSAVRATLEKYVNQSKGFERGRDASRKAIKEAENRITQLLAKNADLEKERQKLKTEVMELWHRI